MNAFEHSNIKLYYKSNIRRKILMFKSLGEDAIFIPSTTGHTPCLSRPRAGPAQHFGLKYINQWGKFSSLSAQSKLGRPECFRFGVIILNVEPLIKWRLNRNTHHCAMVGEARSPRIPPSELLDPCWFFGGDHIYYHSCLSTRKSNKLGERRPEWTVEQFKSCRQFHLIWSNVFNIKLTGGLLIFIRIMQNVYFSQIVITANCIL